MSRHYIEEVSVRENRTVASMWWIPAVYIQYIFIEKFRSNIKNDPGGFFITRCMRGIFLHLLHLKYNVGRKNSAKDIHQRSRRSYHLWHNSLYKQVKSLKWKLLYSGKRYFLSIAYTWFNQIYVIVRTNLFLKNHVTINRQGFFGWDGYFGCIWNKIIAAHMSVRW